MKKFVRAVVSSAVALSGAVVMTAATVGVAPIASAAQPGQLNGQQWSTGLTGTFTPASNIAVVGSALNYQFGAATVTGTETVTATTNKCGIMQAYGVPNGANASAYIMGWPSAAVGAMHNCVTPSSLSSTLTFSKPLVAPILHVDNLDASTYAVNGTSTTGDPITLVKLKGNNFSTPSGNTINTPVHSPSAVGCYNDANGTNPNGACGSIQVSAASGAIQSVNLVNNSTGASGDGWVSWWSFPTLATTATFGPATTTGNSTTLTITFANVGGTGGVTFSNVDLASTLPAGVTLANSNVADNGQCGSPAITATTGAGSVSGTGLDVTAGTTCTITFNVKAASTGTYTMNADDVTSGLGNVVGDGSSTSLTVNPPGSVTTQNETATTTVGTAVTTNVLADATTSGQPLADPTVTSAPAHGTTVVNADGTIAYTPAAGFSGVDSYQYQVCDTSTPAPACSTSTVTVTVNNVFTPGSVTTLQNNPKVTPLSGVATASGKPLDPTDVTSVTAPTHGTIAIDAVTGAVTYTPAPGYSGPDSYVVNVCDTSSPVQCANVNVPVTVTTNTVVANTDSGYTVNSGNSVTIPVLNNDTSASGQSLGIPTIAAQPGGSATGSGTAVVNPDGTITFNSTAGFSGLVSFNYQVCDTGTPQACSQVNPGGLVNLTVKNVMTPQPVTTPQNTPITSALTSLVTVTGRPLKPTGVTQNAAPAHGSISINATTGAVTYTPTPGYTGPDSYKIRVCDTSNVISQCNIVTIPVTVGGNTVTTQNLTATTTVGTGVATSVTSSAVSGNGQAINPTPTVATQPSHGSASVNPDNTVQYTPSTGFSGQDSYTYTVCDTSTPTAVCSTSSVTVTVSNVFTPGSGISTAQNQPTVTSLSNIASTSGKPLDPTKVTPRTAPTHGTISVDPATGAVTYTPAPGYTGPDSYVVNVCDTSNPVQCSDITVPVTVGANTVTAHNDSASTSVGNALTLDVRSNDTSTSGQPLANPTVTSGPAHGAAVVNPDGTITYTPAAGFSGTDSYTYKVCDTSTPTPVCDTATVDLTVDNVFSPGSGVTTPQNQPVTTPIAGIVSTSGSAVDPTTVTAQILPVHGTISIAPNGSVTYTPDPGYSGPDSYVVNVCDVSNPVQCGNVTVPVIVGANTVTAHNDTAATTVGTLVTTDVRANDTSASGQALAKPTVTVGSANGATSVNPNGTIDYTPNAGFSGADSYQYQVCDTGNPKACDTATVTVTVSNVFTPGLGVSTAQNQPAVTSLPSIATTSGKPLDPTKVTSVTDPAHGSISIDPATGAVTYTPTPGYSGPDNYAVNVCDTSSPVQCANVTVPVTVGGNTVTAHDDTAATSVGTAVTTDVRGNDTSASGQAFANPAVTSAPAHGTATVNPNGTITYTPAPGFSGADSYDYQVCDTSTPTPICDTATVNVTVSNVFTDPAPISTAQNVPVTTPMSGISTTSGKPLDPIAVAQGAAPGHGSISINPTSGAVTYTPTPGYSGPDSYSVKVCDTSSPVQCSTKTVTVTVGANSVTATDDSAATTAGNAVTTDVRGNDASASGQSFANPTVTSAPAHGTATVNPNGTITYTPSAGFSGADSYDYQVCDTSTPTPVCDTATVHVQVDNVFTPGTASTSGVTTPQNQAVGTPLSSIASTSGKPLDPTKVTSVTDPAHGSISIDPATGAVTYTPTPGYSGPDNYTVNVCDTASPVQCSDVSVPVTVSANTVTAHNDNATTSVGTGVMTDVRANDTSASGQSFANPTVATNPSNGTAVVNANGTITYTPDAGFSGSDSYTYKVCDTSTPTPVCDTATVNVTVSNVFTSGSGIATPQNHPTTTSLANIATTTGKSLDPTKVTSVTSPTHGSISIDPTTGAVTYTPTPGYSGSDGYVVNVCDTSSPVQCSDITVPVTVSANTVAAANDAATTSVGTGVTTDVRGNDISASGQPLGDPTVTTAPAHGTATVNPDGTITYTPVAGFSGADSYDYQVCDTSNPTPVCSTATVNVTVKNVFTPGPVTGPSPVKTPQNKPITTPIANVVTTTGAPLDPTSVTEVTPPAHGKITIDPVTGTVSYTPKPGYSGPDEYTVNVCDTSTPKQCTNQTIKVVVGPNVVTGTSPVVTTSAGKPTTIDVLSGVHSKSGQKLGKPTIAAQPKHGKAKVNPNGTITYTPAKGFSGTDTFKYTVCDTGTPRVCVTKSVTVHVKGAVVVPSLPDTGGPSLNWLLGGAAAVLAGFSLMVASRRRRA